MKDLYKILNIHPSSSADDVKKAYRKLAIIYHPDKNPSKEAEAKFKVVNEAYKVLIDDEARETYDMEFKQTFHFVKYMKGSTEKKENRKLEQDPAIFREFLVSLEEINQGCQKRFKVSRTVTIGNTVKVEVKILSVSVCPGCPDGTKFTFTEEGNRSLDRIPADIIFVLKTRKHALFQRDYHNLIYVVKISYPESQMETEIYVPIIAGENLKIKITPDDVYTGIILKKHGLPSHNNVNCRGNLIVKFAIVDDLDSKSEKKDKIKDTPIIGDIPVTLEEIDRGCTKEIILTRKFARDDGFACTEEVVLTFKMPPGCEHEMEFKFPNCGHKRFKFIAGDVILIIKQLLHPLFERQGNNLVFRGIITPEQAERLDTVTIPTLSKGKISLKLSKEILEKGVSFDGYGLPAITEEGKLGDLIVYFNIFRM